ncbi:ATP-binding protein [Rhizobium mesoamericanum]|uniref:ATP-binding protein n=1 Tax=Rhizobium mesoamericanum TaxID=1079800 RepID=UPI00042A6ECE|nr:winged helix-turn-helix domain-containing protein [Rhizobium mesoamericanum]
MVSTPISAAPSQGIAFGAFRLLPYQKLLLEDERPVRLRGRAFDVLVALVRHAGEVVGKDELLAMVWPNMFVDEANLRVHVSALRRALGDGRNGTRYIVNEAGRGYSFVAPVSVIDDTNGMYAAPTRSGAGRDKPSLLTHVIGRDDAIAAISEQLCQYRLVTIVGSGGMGKTTVALAVVERHAGRFSNGAAYIDFALTADSSLIASALANALMAPVSSDAPIPGLVAFLRDQDVLLIFDTCEHVVEECAALAEVLLKSAPGVRILATSREPLRAEGERVYRLPALPLPPQHPSISATEALTFPPVQLFVEHATANLNSFELQDTEATAVVEICRRLDGIPLAIEMAAAYVDVFGVYELAKRLDDMFLSLAHIRRTAIPRHHTLRTTLDWSYALLSPAEQTTLRSMAIFVGSFTLETAARIASGPQLDDSSLFETFSKLVGKSLITANINGDRVSYRLLDTTRAYAGEKLAECGEFEQASRRHAEYFLHLFTRATEEIATLTAAAWIGLYGRQIDNVRSALDWAFSPGGDVELGVALTIAAVPLWSHLLLNVECRSRVEMALARLGQIAGPESQQRMQLLAALGGTLLYTKDASRQARRIWEETRAIALKFQDIDYQLRALRGLWADALNGGDIRSARAFSEQFSMVAVLSQNPSDRLIAERLNAQVDYFCGDLKGARTRYQRFLPHYPLDKNRQDTVRFQFDQQLIASADYSRILCILGHAEQALRTVERAICDAEALDSTISMYYALAHAACPIALHIGDLKAAERFVVRLCHRTSRSLVRPWDLWARCWEGVMLSKLGEHVAGARVLADALERVPPNAFHMRYTSFLRHLAEAWFEAGVPESALAAIDKVIEISTYHDEHWADAELLRLKGEVILLGYSEDSVAMAEDHFVRALEVARRQSALCWEMRAAISLASLFMRRRQFRNAKDLLGSVSGKFKAGFETADLVKAQSLLAAL